MPLKSLGLTDSATESESSPNAKQRLVELGRRFSATSVTACTSLRDAARTASVTLSLSKGSVTIVDIAFFYINGCESTNLLYRKPVCDHYSQTDLTFSRLLIKAAPKAHGYGQAGSLQFPESALEKVRLWWQKTPL